MTKLIDVSYSQPNIDYQQVKSSGEVDGVIIRCGRTLWGNFEPGVDSYWKKHYQGFKNVGMPIGAYYYGTANTIKQAEQEADECIKILQGKQLEYPVYYDIEELNTQSNLSKEEFTKIAKTFCEKLEKAGYFVGIYTFTSWFLHNLDWEYLAKKYTLWVADTSPNPNKTITRDIWQYSHKGNIKGIDGPVDLNECYKDFPTIIKNAGLNGYQKQEEIENNTNKTITLTELKNMGIEIIDLTK